MSVHDLLESNKFDLFAGSATINKVKISNITDNNNYVQQLQNKDGTIALIDDIVDSQAYYASLTKNTDIKNTAITVDTNYQLIKIVPDTSSVSLLSNFEKVLVSTDVTGLKYIGTANKKFRITFSCSFAGTNQFINTIRLYKNDGALNFFTNATTYSISETNIIILDCMLELAPNDKLELYIKSTSSLDVEIYCPSFQIISV